MAEDANGRTSGEAGVIETLTQAALDYHHFPAPGKISITPTKGMSNQRDLALAYSPGVAAPCLAIRDDPAAAALYTSRPNLVAVISNGTAVLGLGNIGALAGKPVMEGKGCLFKKFAGIDVFDIEVDETDPDKLVEIIAALEPTFGGINLEDIKAPECFVVETKLRERMKIPVFHDDQHGTAIVAGAAVLNGLEVLGKRIGDVRLVCSGAGAAAIACLDLLVGLGVRKENILILDSRGVVTSDRKNLDAQKARYARESDARTLADAVKGADVFLGVSMAGVLKPDMVRSMADKPLILALANPDPEITPEDAKAARPDCIVATGRSDYPNQVNNVLCFPFIFRGALDVGAKTINEEMKVAATRAIAGLAKEDVSDVVAAAYGAREMRFGPDYLIPMPFDPRLITRVAPAVAEAAMTSGVATRPIDDMKAYRERLESFVYRSGTVMQPVFAAAANGPTRRVAYAEGADERVLRAAQVVVEERLARPILIGDAAGIAAKVKDLGLRLREDRDYDVVAASAAEATRIGATLVKSGKADGLLCGTVGTFDTQFRTVAEVIGKRAGVKTLATMNLLTLPKGTLFIADTYINPDPTAAELTEIALLAAEEVRSLGLVPRMALLSHSNFGSAESPSSTKMREALGLIRSAAPDLEVDGEMRGDLALTPAALKRLFPQSKLTDAANILIMPNLDAANITFNVLKAVAGQGITVGPILLGAAKPAHVLTQVSTVRRIVNMTAVTAVAVGG